MYSRPVCVLFALPALALSAAADAAVHRVFPGESIQAAVDVAAPGDTVLVEPGIYQESGNGRYGLRITTDNLRLIGKVKKGLGEAGKVRLIQNEAQETGVYAGPAHGCVEQQVGDGELAGGCPLSQTCILQDGEEKPAETGPRDFGTVEAVCQIADGGS